jgi:hypothetical protein
VLLTYSYPFLSINDDNGVLRFGNRIEVRIEADRLQLARFSELPALLKQRDLLKFLCVHGPSAREEVRDPHITMSLNGLN